MRKKLNEIRNKEEGFTLVELLAVIVILGIIVAIAVPGVGKVIDNSKTKAEDAEIELVKDATRIYMTVEEDPVSPVAISKLESEGYLELGKGSKLDKEAAIKFTIKDGKIEVPDRKTLFPETTTVDKD